MNDSLVCGECSGVAGAAFLGGLAGFPRPVCRILMAPCSLAVVMDVQDSSHVNCKLYKGLSDALICTDDFIAKVVQR